MAALTADRVVPLRTGESYSDPVEAATLLYAGAIAVLNAAGNLVNATGVAGLNVRGVMLEGVDNSQGVAGAVNGTSRKGVFRFGQDGSITRVDIGQTAYIVDNQTLSLSSNANARTALGPIEDVDAIGVWVKVV